MPLVCIGSKTAKGAGDVNAGERLSQVEWYFLQSQTEWVDTGGSCADYDVQRCKVGSYVQITLACSFQRRINLVDYSKVRQMTNGRDYVCDVNGFLTCSKYSIYDTENYVGPIGTCVKGNAKNGSLCSWVRYPAPENYGEDYVGETVFCDESNGFYCNVIEGEGTNNQSGYCAPFGSVTAGKRASWGLFCENGLYYRLPLRLPNMLDV